MLTDLVAECGQKNWAKIEKKMVTKTRKQCRNRWVQHLDPSIKKEKWLTEEDHLIYLLQRAIGSKWATMATHFVGRADNAIKNRWYSKVSKKLYEYQQKVERFIHQLCLD